MSKFKVYDGTNIVELESAACVYFSSLSLVKLSLSAVSSFEDY